MNETLLKITQVGIVFTMLVTQSFFGHGQLRKLKFGIAAGPSINWLNVKTEGLTSEGTSVSFNYGLYTDFRLEGNENYFISSGIMIQNYKYQLKYSSAVLNTVGNATASQIENALSVNYLEIPIGVKMRSDEIGYSHIAGWFGFGSGFRINSSQTMQEQWLDLGEQKSLKTELNEAKNITKGAKINLKIGAEWERKITGNTFFVLGFTFENGLTNLLSGHSFAVDGNGNTDTAKTNNSLERTGDIYKALPRSIVIHLGVYF